MSRFFLFSFCTFLCFIFGRATGGERPVHVVTVASATPIGFKRLVNSCIQHQIHLNVLGFGCPYSGHVTKLHYMARYLKTLPEDDLVLFVDGYDVIFLKSAEEIAARFLEMKIPFLIGAERTLFPLFLEEPRYKDRYPKASTSFCHLNSGTYIGSVREVKKRIQGALGFLYLGTDDDQGLLTLDFLDHPTESFLDTRCDLFFPLLGISKDEVRLEDGQLECLETGSFPCIAHGNSTWNSYDLYISIYRHFFDDLSQGESLSDEKIRAQCTFHAISLESPRQVPSRSSKQIQKKSRHIHKK